MLHSVRTSCTFIAITALISVVLLPQTAHARPKPPPRNEPRAEQRYSIEQAISERAQLHTIAFNGLAFLTGKFGEATFIPPGKVCDFFGFQYMRDIDQAGKGHNPMFLDRIAGNVHRILDEEQRNLFIELAAEQEPQLLRLAEMRYPVILAFHRLRDGDIPAGSHGLSLNSVRRAVGDVFALDAELSYRRAKAFGQVAAELTSSQKAFLGRMRFGDFNSWPGTDDRGIKKVAQGRSRLFTTAYMTFCSEFFSWYAGSVEADTYFCPERHGTYFGGFHLKDMPAMGKRDYDIDTALTGNSGESFLHILDQDQRKLITAIPALQQGTLSEIVETRRAMAVELRKFLSGDRVDKGKVIEMGRRYGELDGRLSWLYATAFCAVDKTIDDSQWNDMLRLRGRDDYGSAPAYIYSDGLRNRPDLPDTDHLFFEPQDD